MATAPKLITKTDQEVSEMLANLGRALAAKDEQIAARDKLIAVRDASLAALGARIDELLAENGRLHDQLATLGGDFERWQE